MRVIRQTLDRVALFSPCGQYRYVLIRTWNYGKGRCTFICLNPSTADLYTNDPTVKRCIEYAKAWGYREFVMLNCFAWRSTDRTVLPTVAEPIGPKNDYWVIKIARESDLVVAAWGADASLMDRAFELKKELFYYGVELKCLAVNQDGSPGHPLYLKKSAKLVSYG